MNNIRSKINNIIKIFFNKLKKTYFNYSFLNFLNKK